VTLLLLGLGVLFMLALSVLAAFITECIADLARRDG
jgi:Na+-transporting methylmalonyl-CoA/oxaloacetate decarboxylase gamma subunit